MKPLQLTALLLLALFGFSATAYGQTVWERNTRNSREIWLLYSEDGAWRADRYLQKKNDLQDRMEQHEFATQAEAEKFLQTRTKKFILRTQTKNRDTQKVGRLFPEVNRNIWTVTQQWNADWEHAFETWYREQFHPSYFVQYNIPTDCADAAYAARWIFARQNGLPASAQLAGTDELITQDTVRPSWRNLPTHQNWWEDQLFITAINYVTDNTFTHTLNQDTYPVEITPEYVLPGTIYLSISTNSGHTRMLYRMGPSTQISMLYSTVPRAVRALGTEIFRPSTAAQAGRGGLVKFRWPYLDGNVWKLTPASAMRGYSLEQHQPEFVTPGQYFYQAVQRRIFGDVVDRDYDDMRSGLETLKSQLEARVGIVRDGFEFCQQNDCSPGSQGYEDWSTPSRDGRTRESIQQLIALANASQDARVRALWNSTASSYTLEVTAGVIFRWQNLISIFQTGIAASDPNVPIHRRWGIQTIDSFQIETAHPYQDRTSLTWLLYVPEGQNIQLFFDLFDMESRYDYVTITDAQARSTTLTGRHAEGLLSDPVLGGGLISISFTTDSSITGQGFRLQRIDRLP